jgi:tetratricopeptide (TPR) repeat protein
MFGARRRARDEFRHTVHALTEAARTGDATAAAAAITRLGDLLPRLRRGDPAIDEAVPPVGQIAARLLGTAGPALGPALTVFRSLLTAAQFDAGLQAALLMSVGEDLLRSARETHERQLVDEAVKLGDAAVAAAEPGSQLQAVMLSMLGEACQLRFSNSGDAADLERALEAYRTAADRVTARVLPLRLTGDVRILCLSGLGSCLSLQFQQTADLRVLDEAITAYRRALRIVPPDDLSRPGYLDKLSIALHRRYQATGSADALNEAITLSAEAVETGVPDSTGYASWLHTPPAHRRPP